MDASSDYFVYTKTDENFIGIYRKQFDISELMHNQKTINFCRTRRQIDQIANICCITEKAREF